VLTYLPKGREDFYGAATIHQLAKDMPDVEFLAVGGDGDDAPSSPNLRFLGRVEDMPEIYRKTSVLVRLTQHDGLPKMLLESMAMGRNVVWSFPFPHCLQAKTTKEAAKALLQLRRTGTPNLAGARYVISEFGPDRIIPRLADTIRRLLE
jgi:glycosyltransferase involved in cell wall biosynthesis